MLTKTLKFDDDVLDVIKSMEWADDGRLGVITGGQLARDLYVRVNKALEAMGGKWDRKAGGHMFKLDPRSSVDGLLENGSIAVERDGFFETPIKIVNRMLELVPITERCLILEPSAGLGAIAKNLPAERGLIICVEKNPDRAAQLEDYGFETYCADFLNWGPQDKFGLIYMNPPFEELQDIDHVMHAYDLLADGGYIVSVMSESPFFRTDKKAIKFRYWLDGCYSHYAEKLPAGSFKESGTGVNARLIVICK